MIDTIYLYEKSRKIPYIRFVRSLILTELSIQAAVMPFSTLNILSSKANTFSDKIQPLTYRHYDDYMRYIP